MATLTLRDSGEILQDAPSIGTFLEKFGIWYRRFEGSDTLTKDATTDEILAAYDEPISRLKREGGYVTADVINIHPEVPNPTPCSPSSAASTGTPRTRSASSSTAGASSTSTPRRGPSSPSRW